MIMVRVVVVIYVVRKLALVVINGNAPTLPIYLGN